MIHHHHISSTGQQDLALELTGVNPYELVGGAPASETGEQGQKTEQEPFVRWAHEGHDDQRSAKSDAQAALNRVNIRRHNYLPY